jgi:mannobiose 2-epimerase
MAVVKQQSGLKTELFRELQNILAFWENRMVDERNGGFLGAIDFDGHIIEGAGKGAVLNARILWTFSKAYNTSQEGKYLLLAERAYEYIESHFWDKMDGGVFWHLSAEGQIRDDRKQTYAQAFALYGLAEYYKASKSNVVLERCFELFDLLELKARDLEQGGYVEAYAGDWSKLDDMRLSEKDINAPKTLNTHLHVLEAYTNLFKVCRHERVRRALVDMTELFLDKYISNSGHLNLFFNKQWRLQSDLISYGHDIETAWLLHDAAKELDSESLLKQVVDAAVRIGDQFMKVGMLPNGGVLYENHSRGMDGEFMEWWGQAEAMVGLYDCYQITRDEKYLEAVHIIWDFIKSHFFNKKQGEWYWAVDVTGNPIENKELAGFWKCPYHNARMCFELLSRISN